MKGLYLANRYKRGLFNILGSVYKFLFSTLNDTDREKVQNQLNTLSNNIIQTNELNHIINKVNTQILEINK